MENYLDVNMQKYDKYRTLSRIDPHNPTLYQYKLRKYGNRVMDALNTPAQTGGTSIQSIGDTYLTNLDTYDRIKRVNKLLGELQTTIHYKKVNQECVKDFATFMTESDGFLTAIDVRRDREISLANDVTTKVDRVNNNADAILKIFNP